jgi:uncharacterized membrane protein
MTAPRHHPDLHHPRAHRRAFARFALWFADWQGTPTFIALLTLAIISELAWNQVIAPLTGLDALRFDANTWLLNLSLSLLASYAASLSVMGGKVQTDRQNRQLDRLEAKLDRLLADRESMPPR